MPTRLSDDFFCNSILAVWGGMFFTSRVAQMAAVKLTVSAALIPEYDIKPPATAGLINMASDDIMLLDLNAIDTLEVSTNSGIMLD